MKLNIEMADEEVTKIVIQFKKIITFGLAIIYGAPTIISYIV